MSGDLHRTPTCTGIFNRDGRHWRGSTCRALAYGCPDVERAVALEHAMGHQLRELAAEGAKLLR